MKSNFAVFVVLSLLLVGNLRCAASRKDLGEYWKNMMKEQPMPQAIKDLLEEYSQPSSDAAENKKDRFIRDFDVKPNVILYHTHSVSIKQHQKPFVNN